MRPLKSASLKKHVSHRFLNRHCREAKEAALHARPAASSRACVSYVLERAVTCGGDAPDAGISVSSLKHKKTGARHLDDVQGADPPAAASGGGRYEDAQCGASGACGRGEGEAHVVMAGALAGGSQGQRTVTLSQLPRAALGARFALLKTLNQIVRVALPLVDLRSIRCSTRRMTYADVC